MASAGGGRIPTLFWFTMSIGDTVSGASQTGFGGEASSGRASRRNLAAEVRIQLDKLFEKAPPHSPEAEMALLGAMLLDPTVIADVIQVVRSASWFYQEVHAAIFAALVHTFDRHQAGDLVMLAAHLQDNELVKAAGGPRYLEKLASETPGAASAPHYARIVAEKARLRRLIDAGGQIVYEAYHSTDVTSEGAKEVIDRAEKRIFEIAQEDEASDPQALAQLLQLEYDRLEASQGEALTGIDTGYRDLNELLCGLQKGEFIIVAARPSMGKTAFALNLAENIALGGAPYSHHRAPDGAQAGRVAVGFFSLEMSKSAIAQRMLSARSAISSQRMRSGRMTEDDYRRLLEACGELGEAPVYIDDAPALTVLGLRTRARRMVAQYGIKCVFVDYLQLMTSPASARESRQVEVSAISRGLKALARELNIPVVCLSQLNRGPESRENNRPRMSDLRESGSIEQDADVVMLLHREEYYHVNDPSWAQDPDNEDKIGVAEIIIAKQRNGPTGVVSLKWDSETTRFKDLMRSGGGYAGDSPFGSHAPAVHVRPGGGVAPRPVPAASTGRPPWEVADEATTIPAAQSFAPGRTLNKPLPGQHRDGGGPEREFDEDTASFPTQPPIDAEDDDETDLPI